MFSYVPYGVQGIAQEQIFGGAPQTADGPIPASAARDTTVPAPMAMADHAVTISWIGVVIALVILRVLYEFSE